MAAIDVEVVCKICGKWKATGIINADEINVLPNVLKFVQKEISKHKEHGLGGQWQINYNVR